MEATSKHMGLRCCTSACGCELASLSHHVPYCTTCRENVPFYLGGVPLHPSSPMPQIYATFHLLESCFCASYIYILAPQLAAFLSGKWLTLFRRVPPSSPHVLPKKIQKSYFRGNFIFPKTYVRQIRQCCVRELVISPKFLHFPTKIVILHQKGQYFSAAFGSHFLTSVGFWKPRIITPVKS